MNKVEPSPPGTAGPQLAFIDCSYTVTITKDNKPTTPLTRALCKGSNKPKRLLNNVTAEVRAGSVLAILGPSGAGKTTLLNMLTLEPKGGEPVGHLRLNGKPCNFTTYNQYCAYVQQVRDVTFDAPRRPVPRPHRLSRIPTSMPLTLYRHTGTRRTRTDPLLPRAPFSSLTRSGRCSPRATTSRWRLSSFSHR